MWWPVGYSKNYLWMASMNCIERSSTSVLTRRETIKIKNLELRKLFLSKYQELINCSQLRDDLSDLAAKVDQTAAEIGRSAQTYRSQPISLTERKDVIGVVERLIRRGKYFDAMVMIVQKDNSSSILCPNETQILGIIEVDLVEKAMARLETQTLHTELDEVVKTLTAFIYFAAQKYILEGVNYDA